MNSKGDLLVYKHKGRPTLEEAEVMKCSQKMKKQLNQLKKDMNYAEGTKIIHGISLASDEMMRAVHMFPEVIYGDVTDNTNCQKSDLFLWL